MEGTMRSSRARRLIQRVAHTLAYHLYVKPAMRRTHVTSMSGLLLSVPPTVFHPRFYLTSRFLGEHLLSLDLGRKALLDMGCGSGILSLIAARRGALVTAVDINPVAVESTRDNARINGLEVRVVQGDLFDHLDKDDTFDYIVWNPPFYQGEPSDHAGHAWYAGKGYRVIARFASEARAHLRPGGRIILVVSSATDVGSIVSNFTAEKFTPNVVRARRRFFEFLSIYELATPP